MYLAEDKNEVIVISQNTVSADSKELYTDSLNYHIGNDSQSGSYSEYYLIDVTDISHPNTLSHQSLEGDLIDTRHVLGTTHVITRYSFPIFKSLATFRAPYSGCFLYKSRIRC